MELSSSNDFGLRLRESRLFSYLNRSFRLSRGRSFRDKSRIENCIDENEKGLEPASRPLEMVAPRIDSYRFSMANLEDSQDAELDAILGELCALHSHNDNSSGYASSCKSNAETCSVSGSSVQSGPVSKPICLDTSMQRTDSPDNDSAFSDTVSMLSGESSASSGASSKCKGLKLNLQQNPKDSMFQQKADKIKLALERMKEASTKKLFIKAFSMDGSSKSLLVDEKMTCGYVSRILADKNHVTMEPKWAIVENLPDLHMERVYEDHEILVENLMLWTRESKNKIIFSERPDKISLFLKPENYLFANDEKLIEEQDEHSRQVMLEEFFGPNNGASNLAPSISGHNVPPVEGPLFLKSEAKKGWKKYHFVLRPSGLYYYPKEKQRTINELVCLASFDNDEVYLGLNWKKKYKSPTDYCFAIKNPRLQQPKSIKFIKFLCADDQQSLDRWIVAMRIAKHGRKLLDNYRVLVEELSQDDLDHLAKARSCSLSSIVKSNGQLQHNMNSPMSQSSNNSVAISETSSGRHSRASSSSSSGCLSDGGTTSENAFDCEFPMGTIKRKPSMKPIIPLTSVTRQLKEMAEEVGTSNNNKVNGTVDQGSGTLTRRQGSRRANVQINGSDGTLKRHRTDSQRSTPTSCTIRTPSPLYTRFDIKPEYRDSNLSTYGYVNTYSQPTEPQTDVIDDQTDYATCYEALRDNKLSSCVSLESLPPPPPPEEHEDFSGSQLSLPPPPDDKDLEESMKPNVAFRSPIDEVDKSCDFELRRKSFTRKPSLDSFTSSHSSERNSLKGIYSRPTIKSEEQKNNSFERKSSIKKRVNFADEIRYTSPRKPVPPKRNESTRLTSPKKLADSNSNPPDDFLKDLQRVMRKKWQVAQKCKLEPDKTPHEVLGFREYPLGEEYREASVSMWVQEHYGTPTKKRAPPVPPPRSHTTQLTSQHNIYNY